MPICERLIRHSDPVGRYYEVITWLIEKIQNYWYHEIESKEVFFLIVVLRYICNIYRLLC